MKKYLLIVILFFLLIYLTMPILNYGFYSVGVIVLMLLFVLFLLSLGITTDKAGKKFIVNQKPKKWMLWAMAVVLVYLTVVPFITSATFLHTSKYQKMIGEVKKGSEISKHIAPISMDKIRVVDQDLAYLLGEKIIGSQPALGSQIQLGRFSIQKVNNELFWVAPLLHSGFFKWFNNQEGTPGYVMVSATNERDVRLVETINNKPLHIKYQPAAYFQSDIQRHVYFNGFASTGLEDFVFEIDEAGNPYWVISTYQKEIGFSGKNATGVLVVDAQTGAIQQYAIADTPAWVDRIQPAVIVEEQLNDWGELINGYWNFSNRDKLQITEGLTLVYGKNDRSYWYTGLTSVGSDESAVGFVLVDTRTKETTFYKQSGATEYAAQQSAEGKVQEKGYVTSLPIPYNINGIPTYVMTLKDDGGLVKMYAMVAINDYTIVGVGNSMRETLTAFKSAYNSSGNKINPGTAAAKKSIKSVITRIQSDVKNGNSFYYFTIKDYPRIFVGSTQVSGELPITVVGDSIEISFDIDEEKIIDVTRFDNKAYQ
jgi:energy-coupling factor transporter transmembrane protein EcfT